MRAQALRAWASRVGGHSLEVTQHQALEQTHGFYRLGVELYNTIQRRAPAFHHFYFNELELLSLFKNPDRLAGRERFCSVVRELRPHVVVSVHGSTNHGFFDLARRTLGADRVRCVTYCGELFGGYGFSRHWVNPAADLFIGAVPETCEAAAALGMPASRRCVGGFLLRPEFYEEALSAGAREEAASDLQIDPQAFTLLLSTGANGANNHQQFLRALGELRRPFQVLALCGADERTRALIDAQRGRWPHLLVRALGRREDMAALMQVASAIVARPGTGTTSEAINLGCPLILNGAGGVMPQEWITVKFCRRHRLGDVVYWPSQLARAVGKMLDRPELLARTRENLRRVRPGLHPSGILQMVRGGV